MRLCAFRLGILDGTYLSFEAVRLGKDGWSACPDDPDIHVMSVVVTECRRNLRHGVPGESIAATGTMQVHSATIVYSNGARSTKRGVGRSAYTKALALGMRRPGAKHRILAL